MTDTAELKPVAWTNEANLRVMRQNEPLFYACIHHENTAEWNVPLYSADAISSLVRERDEAREAAYDQPHGPTSRILWSTRYRELLDDYKAAEARATTAEAERDSWRRVSERLEGEKLAAEAEAEAEASRLRAENSAALSNTSEGGVR